MFHCLPGLVASLDSFRSLFPWNASLFSGCLQGFFPLLWFLVVWSWCIWARISSSLSCFRLSELAEFVCLLSKQGSFQSCFLQTIFSAPLFLITFWNTDGTNVRPSQLSHRILRICSFFFFFKSLFSLFFRIDNFYSCHFYLHIHKLFPLLYPLWFWTNSVTLFSGFWLLYFFQLYNLVFFFYGCTSLLLGTWF